MAALFIKPKGEATQTPSSDECINRMCYSHIMDFYLAIIGTKVLIHAKTWMNLENTVHEKSQTPKNTHCKISFA